MWRVVSVVPLRFRVPNPPPVFVGRDHAVDDALAKLERSPVLLIAGPAGSGKSAFARAVVRRSSAYAPGALTIAARPGADPVQLLHELHRALEPTAVFDAELDALEQLLDLTDRQARMVLIEDIHHTDAPTVMRWLSLVAAYGRQCRWLATTRDAEGFEPSEQLITLEPLTERAATELVRECAARLDSAALAQIVHRGAGRPDMLRRLAFSARSGGVTALSAVSPDAMPLVATLAHTLHALSREQLSALVALPPSDQIAALVRSGLVVDEAGERLRLHDRARDSLAANSDAGPEAAARLAAYRGDDPETLAEALRLLAAAGDAGSLRAFCAAHAGSLIDSGQSARVWSALRGFTSDEALRPWALRAALKAQTPTSMAWVAQASQPSDPALGLAWLRARRGRVPFATVIADVRALVERARATKQFDTVQALLLEGGEAAMHFGELPLASELIGAPESTAPLAIELRRASLTARLGLLLGDHELVEQAAARVTALSAELPRDERSSASLQAAMVRGDDGMADTDPSAAVNHAPTTGSTTLEAAKSRGFWGLYLTILNESLAGRVALGDAAMAELNATAVARHDEVLLRVIRAVHAITSGPHADFKRLADEAVRLAVERGDWLGYHWTRAAQVMASWLAAVDNPAVPWPEGLAPPAGVPGRYVALVETLAELDRGGTDVQLKLATDSGNRSPVDQLAEAVFDTAYHLFAGRMPASELGASRILRLIGDTEWHLIRVGALSVAATAYAIASNARGLQRALTELDRIREVADGPFVNACADLHLAALAPVPDAAVLERLAGETRFPTLAVWARAVLTQQAPHRGFDQLIFRASQAINRAQWRFQTPLSRERGSDQAGAWVGGWGYNRVSRTVWLDDGTRVGLGRKPMLRTLLESIIDARGAVTKQELVERVWQRDYHPLNDDGRLHKAVSRLREALNDSSAAPRLICTADDGYRLGDLPFTELRVTPDD